ncbi:VanZ family protein, partial [bacterium]|nr:VanZ family protein [bacterium]
MSRTTTGTSSKLLLLALGYAALLAYGTLYPFADWSTPDYNITARIFSGGFSGSPTDILVNFLVYLPFGLLFFKGLPARWSSVLRLVVVTAVGAAISYSLECGQAYMPARVPSLLDLCLNTASAFAGGLLALVSSRDSRIGARLYAWRRQYFKAGPEGTLGLFVVGFWSLSQLTPLVPSLDVGLLWDGIKPLWLT